VRFTIMHKTNAQWESGAIPTPELIARVGQMVGGLAKAKVLLGAEGLRASSEGVRLTFSGGQRTVTKGPFKAVHELPAGFSILQTASLDEAIDWASRQAAVLGDVEIDIRPVTEAWDIGVVPKPANVTTRRYMALRKATASTEAGVKLTAAQRAEMARLMAESVHLTTESLQPSASGKRYTATSTGIHTTDGPFAESKELIAGYVIVSAQSVEDADRWAREYFHAVGAGEVDLRLLEDQPA